MKEILIEKYQQPTVNDRNELVEVLAWHDKEGQPDRKNNLPAIIVKSITGTTLFFCRSGEYYKEIIIKQKKKPSVELLKSV